MPARWTRALLALYLLVLVVAEATATNPADPDLWHRLAVGEFLCQSHHFPVGGTFSYLADYRDIADHEWGSALIFYAAYRVGGGAAIILIKILSLAATVALIVAAGLQGRRATLFHGAFYALVILALLPSFQSTVRCMVFTHFFLALWLFWYQRESNGRAVPAWAYAITMAVWANLHGGFTLGLLWLLGVTLVQAVQGANWRPWLVRFALCAVATLLNPFGWRLWISTGRALLVSRQGFGEWAHVSWWPPVLDYPGYKLLLLLVIMALIIFLVRGRPRHADRPAFIFILAALGLSLLSARHTSIFAAVAGVFLPGLFPTRRPPVEDLPPLRRLGEVGLGFALTVVPLFAAFRALPGDGLRLRFPSVSCPVASIQFLQRQDVRGNLLVPFNYGSYALWQLRGRLRVSMDGRYDLVYLPATYRRVDDFFSARGNWSDLLQHPAPSAILLPVTAPVYARLRSQPGWVESYRDANDAVFLPRITSK